jgi:NAD(P)-dependent dehydrogenase (short-subunit alcohol dehydrogenase family)
VQKGCKAAIWDCNERKGQALAIEIGAAALYIKCDVSCPVSVESALERTLQAFSRVDILINTAGIFYSASIEHLSFSQFDKVVKTNLYGTFNTCRSVAKCMFQQPAIESERGVIINTGSISGIEGRRGQTAYGASKGAVIGMTLPMARDLGAIGIRVLSIAPGFFETPMTEAISQDTKKAVEKEIALKRAGRVEEYARAVQFLIENTYMTGSTLRLDGGMRLPHL